MNGFAISSFFVRGSRMREGPVRKARHHVLNKIGHEFYTSHNTPFSIPALSST